MNELDRLGSALSRRVNTDPENVEKGLAGLVLTLIDIVRELIDGAAGLREGNDNMAPGDKAWWESYRGLLERAAREAGQDVAREAG